MSAAERILTTHVGSLPRPDDIVEGAKIASDELWK
jgi:hypothetical protein